MFPIPYIECAHHFLLGREWLNYSFPQVRQNELLLDGLARALQESHSAGVG